MQCKQHFGPIKQEAKPHSFAVISNAVSWLPGPQHLHPALPGGGVGGGGGRGGDGACLHRLGGVSGWWGWSTGGGRGAWHYQQLRQSSVFYRSVWSPVTCLARARFKAHSKNQATTPLYEVHGTRYPKIGVLHEVKLKVHHPTKHSFTFSLMDTKLIFAPIYWKNQKTSIIEVFM